MLTPLCLASDPGAVHSGTVPEPPHPLWPFYSSPVRFPCQAVGRSRGNAREVLGPCGAGSQERMGFVTSLT